MEKQENSIYKQWLESTGVSDEMKQAMAAMTDDQVAASFSDKPLEFGTAGYRSLTGPGPLFLNEHTYQQLTVAYAKFVKSHFKRKLSNMKPKVIVAHDNRIDGEKYAALVASVLTAHKIKVIMPGKNLPLHTPIVSFLLRFHGYDGGINITASHNPKEYNGFKAYNSLGAQVTTAQAKEITAFLPNQAENLVKKYRPRAKLIEHIEHDDIHNYFDDVTKHINLNQYKQTNNPIVFTSHHGTCSLYVVDYLKSLGHNMVPVKSQCFLDPNFVNSAVMNPEDSASFAESLKVAKTVNADIMLGVDPDGDRLAVAIKHNDQWHYLNGNQTGILATNYILRYSKFYNFKPIIISTFVTNNLIDKIVKNFGGCVIRTGTGFKNIANEMEKINPKKARFIIGFEEAIGMCISDSIREKDGIAASALVIEMYQFYKNQNKDLMDVLNTEIYPKHGYWYGETVPLVIPGNDWKEKAEVLRCAALNMKPFKLGDFNIEKVSYNSIGDCIEWKLANDSWINFRISGTEPKFKIYFNLYFNDDKPAAYDLEKYQNVVKSLTKEIKNLLF